MQKTLEFRKIIQVGYRFDRPEVPPILDAQGRSLEPVKQPYHATIVLWIPCRPGYYQRTNGFTRVQNATRAERQALRDGALIEEVIEVTFPEEPTVHEMGRRLMPVWEAVTRNELQAERTNGVPIDLRTHPTFDFTPVARTP